MYCCGNGWDNGLSSMKFLIQCRYSCCNCDIRWVLYWNLLLILYYYIDFFSIVYHNNFVDPVILSLVHSVNLIFSVCFVVYCDSFCLSYFNLVFVFTGVLIVDCREVSVIIAMFMFLVVTQFWNPEYFFKSPLLFKIYYLSSFLCVLFYIIISEITLASFKLP